MKTVIIRNKEVRLYDSIDEMPIVNFQKYNKYLLIDSGIGSDADDVDRHIIRVAKLIKAGDSKKAMQELQNMRQNMHMVNSEISPKYLAFAALVHSIDGKEITDLSDENLKAVLDQINSVRHSRLLDLLMRLKKKVSDELETYFPGDFSNAKEKEIYDRLKRRTQLVLDTIINDTDNKEQIEAIDAILFGMYNPKCFIGSDSIEVSYDKQFETTCLLIAQKANMDAKKMTVLQFYSALDTIKKQAEAEAKAYKRNKPKR